MEFEDQLMGLQIRRIDCADGNTIALIDAIRRQLSPDGDVVSERGRALTKKVFGEVLSPARSVERICNDVRSRGWEAVQHYSRGFDNFELSRDKLRVSLDEMKAAHRKAEAAFLETIRRVRKAILEFQIGVLHRDAMLRRGEAYELQLRYRPVRRVGVCVPGGAAAYPSTLLMTVCPAQAAGVQEIAVVAPPTRFGAANQDVLAVCHELGVTEVYRLGGAQAVAALAFGVEGLPRVDMIVGPGNLFVALAKRFVYGQVGIDMLAGPTEVVVIADEAANPEYLASDLLSQAEHAPGASILITWAPHLLDAVQEALEEQLEELPRGELARESLEQFGALILARDAEEAVALANAIAPEHLHLCTRDAEQLVGRILNAGAIFVGPQTPVALGDYVAGPSHVLPTGGTARFASGLSSNDFLRRSSVIWFSQAGLEEKAADVRMLADKEGLAGHRRSVDIRLGVQSPLSLARTS
jgi:histidinol dehydrogenase